MSEASRVIRVLLVEDDEDDALLVEARLRRDGLNIETFRVDSAEAMLAALEAKPWDIVLSDYSIPGFSGLMAFDILRTSALDVPFIFVSGTVGEDAAVKAMRLGAADYLLKGDLGRLAPAILREVRERWKRDEQAALEIQLRETIEAKEEQLRQAQKMEAIGRLAGGVAHDFNNMLSVIICNAELASVESISDQDRLEHLEEIREASKRAAELTKQLLLFSHHQDPERRVLDLNPLVASTQQLCRRLVGADIELVVRAADSAARVRANAGHIEQVLMNLVVNARDAMPHGGRLTLETTNLELKDTTGLGALSIRPGPYVRVSVADTGIGMDEGTQARIFEPFFSTKERGKGTGLGLSTVFGIVQQSQGTIDVQSEPGRGTTFHVYLPRVEAPVEQAMMPTQPPTMQGTETILVVENEDGVRNVARTILRRQGYTVLEASTPEAALALFDRHPEIRLVLSDIVLPRMNGVELARALRGRRAHARILFMSGYTDETRMRYPITEGDALLQKPFTPESLARKVRERLDG
jgi:two-component system cell cycle sensor histidine kinase/response regulator CckA